MKLSAPFQSRNCARPRTSQPERTSTFAGRVLVQGKSVSAARCASRRTRAESGTRNCAGIPRQGLQGLSNSAALQWPSLATPPRFGRAVRRCKRRLEFAALVIGRQATTKKALPIGSRAFRKSAGFALQVLEEVLNSAGQHTPQGRAQCDVP